MEEQILQNENFFAKLLRFYKNNSLIINFVILSLMFFANCFFVPVAYLALPLAFIMMLWSNTKNGLSYIIFIFPFCWFELAFGMCMLAVCLLTWVIKMLYIKIHRDKEVCCIRPVTLILIVCCLAFCVLPVSGIYTIHVLIKAIFIAVMLAFVYFMIRFPEEFRLKYNSCVLACALLTASAFALFRTTSDVLLNMIEIYPVTSQLIRFSALFYNPNNLALVCEIGMSILAFFYVTNRCTKRDIFSFLVFLSLGIFTFSKTFAIIAGILLIMLLYGAIKHRSKIAWITLGLSISVCLCLAIIKYDILLVYLNRISVESSGSDVADAITTGRFDLWIGYFNYIIGNPLALFFGKGLGAPRIASFNGVKFGPHNLYIAILYQLGLVGFALLVVTIVFVVVDARKHKKKHIGKPLCVPLLLIAAIAMVEDFILYIA